LSKFEGVFFALHFCCVIKLEQFPNKSYQLWKETVQKFLSCKLQEMPNFTPCPLEIVPLNDGQKELIDKIYPNELSVNHGANFFQVNIFSK